MKHKNVYWGLFFIIAAIIIILNQTGLLGGTNIFSLIITLLVIPVILKSIRYLNFGGILFPLAIIGILYAEPLGIEYLTPWPILGVALFLSIGLSFIFPQHHFKRWENHFRENDFSEEWVAENVEESEVINMGTKFSGSVKYINTDNLKNVNIHCSFGGMKVYFDHANIQGEEANIRVDVNFGGLELFIPKEWNVIYNTDNAFGGIEEKNRSQITENSKKIRLTGKVNFAGITIIYI